MYTNLEIWIFSGEHFWVNVPEATGRRCRYACYHNKAAIRKFSIQDVRSPNAIRIRRAARRVVWYNSKILFASAMYITYYTRTWATVTGRSCSDAINLCKMHTNHSRIVSSTYLSFIYFSSISQYGSHPRDRNGASEILISLLFLSSSTKDAHFARNR